MSLVHFTQRRKGREGIKQKFDILSVLGGLGVS
jgi:hypothetical protein